jgi:transposase
VDEFGPLEIRPVAGHAWSLERKPARLPATYTRPHGVQHLLAAYDVGQDKLWGTIKARKRWMEFLSFLKSLRKRYPLDKRIHIVLDNFSPHLKTEVRRWCRKNRISLVFTATNASWMNRIECHFWPLRKFTLCNSNYQSKSEQARAIHKYLRWRNKNKKHEEILKLQNKHYVS